MFVQVIAEYRTAEGVPFLEALLRNGEPKIWKVALDGLVMCGGAAALAALRAAMAITTLEKREWMDEAVGAGRCIITVKSRFRLR